jgi:hypothetical protein
LPVRWCRDLHLRLEIPANSYEDALSSAFEENVPHE